MSKLQNIWLHAHAEKRIFHVSINNADLPKSATNWSKLASNARYAYSQVGEFARQKSMEAGIYIAMVNTNYEGWQTFLIHQDVTFDEAVNLKNIRIWHLEDIGWINVGSHNKTVKNQGKGAKSWAQWNKPWNPNNMTMKKVNEKIDFINVSLQMEISKNIRSAAVMEIIGTKPTANFEVNNMSTLLMFIRQKMGLE